MNRDAKLVVTSEGGVRRITFDNPARRNALDLATFALFAEAVREAARDESRVLVITGAGDSFCGGLDLSSLSAEELARLDVAAKIRELINPPILGLRAMRKPVVARVNGPVAGIGFSYVLASDVRVASEDATFTQSFVRVGLMPDGGGTHFLPALVGYAKAFELMATGAQLSARDALALGLVNRVVPRGELDAAVGEVVSSLASAPRPALALIKAALARREHEALAAALDFEAEAQAECFRSSDFAEGIAAFMQKRAPEFGKGRG
ncbi:MAG TPA: enoyl-CoA hydratase-related protein [Pyrinomonadaceae bacterium]|jgi:enoyl-CoA hydratase/carnithine racemase|nr:enoyl-CoA hydratase-related protein [Pyrinomonadaceae bacterium]